MDAKLRAAAKSKMVETEFYMSMQDRLKVEETVRSHSETRGWCLHRVHARTNHVHVVNAAHHFRPEAVRDQLKPWCTRMLKRDHPSRQRFWTEGASVRYINHDEDLEAAIEYAGDAQTRKSCSE